MYRATLDAIITELCIGQCMRDVARYWTFRSTVPGPGLRAASEFLCQRYRENGIQAQVLAYPADDKTEWVGGHRNPLAWVPRRGRLAVVEPAAKAGLVCSYAQEPLSLICYSVSTPGGGTTARVVVVPAGDKDADYAGLDVSGAIILTDASAHRVDAQARKRGAVGVISDSVCRPWMLTQYPPPREPEDTPDLTMWDVLSGKRNEAPLWGFSLSPRQGRRLKELIRDSQEAVLLRAEVDADLVEGTSEVVSAVLPGTDLAHEEVWLLAHSSEPGAEDNASGCCLAVEIARTLKALIEQGVLPPLRRTIRFLHGVEVEGYLPYLDARGEELQHVLAGLCFDAVGQDFSQVRGEFVMARCPETNASCVDALLEDIFRSVAAEPIRRFSSDTFAPFPWRTSPYWSNDAFISDGCFDIPSPEMSTWPERFYHSSQDTPDKLSDNTLGRAGAIGATYLALLAAAGPREATWLAGLSAADWKQRVISSLSSQVLKSGLAKSEGDSIGARELARHLGYQATDALRWALRFAPDDGALGRTVGEITADLRRFVDQEGERASALAATLAGHQSLVQPASDDLAPAGWDGDRIAKRLRWEAPTEAAFSEAGQERLRSLRGQVRVAVMFLGSIVEVGDVERAWAWLNGRRSLEEVWERLQFGGAVRRQTLGAYLDLLVMEKFAAWRES